jgi:putative tryptophan/tyrosine transport system substrate-binding protein
MNRRETLAALLLLGAASVVRAQRPGRPYRIGMAWIADAATVQPYQDAFLAGLRTLGFERGRNLVVDVRNCNGNQSLLPSAVDELIALKPDLLAGIEQVARVMRQKTATIPIVLTQSNDPIAAGLVKTLSRPGGNVTGMSAMTELTAAKNAELLFEIVPRVRKLAMFLDPGVPASGTMEEHVRAVAHSNGATLMSLYVKDRPAVEQAFVDFERERPDALLPGGGSGMLFGERKFIAERCLALRIPASGGALAWAQVGCLTAYGASLQDMMRRSASHAARILRGTSPGAIPIEQASVFELIINLKTAKTLGISIPPAMLLRANRVIE